MCSRGWGPRGPKMVLGVYGTHGPQGPTKSLHANKEDAYNVFDSWKLHSRLPQGIWRPLGTSKPFSRAVDICLLLLSRVHSNGWLNTEKAMVSWGSQIYIIDVSCRSMNTWPFVTVKCSGRVGGQLHRNYYSDIREISNLIRSTEMWIVGWSN